MSKDYHFPNFSFVQWAFLYSVRFLLTHPVFNLLHFVAVRCALCTVLGVTDLSTAFVVRCTAHVGCIIWLYKRICTARNPAKNVQSHIRLRICKCMTVLVPIGFTHQRYFWPFGCASQLINTTNRENPIASRSDMQVTWTSMIFLGADDTPTVFNNSQQSFKLY